LFIITVLDQHTDTSYKVMASQHSPQSNDSGHEVCDLPDPVHIQSHIFQSLPSPPSTIKKKIVSIFSKIPLNVHESKRSSGRIKLNPLDPGQCPQSPRRTCVKLCCVFAVLLGFFYWWRTGTAQDLETMRQRANNLTKNLLPSGPLDGMSFIPANNRHIHVSAEGDFQTNTKNS
jgi:hypothetical protein